MRGWIAAGIAVGLLAGLTGCDNPKRALGLQKEPPDEFAVVTRAPLSLPPDFNLRPPSPGSARPQEGTTRDQARRVITGAPGAGGVTQRALPEGASEGERALLTRAGTDRAIPDIRAVVEEETSVLAEESRGFADVLLFWREPESFGTQLDATAESRRLRENRALGQPPTTGASPSIERREKGILEGLF
ncbi:DUF3035 domain-containing protein [Roseospira marina]|uniref:DUF3035 domain-containing protein n=1 Tax=Roseospira marina TaxID=140057 RepID=A0A5M6I8K0_9PROT|nr:DUF3035 domain-containing protein [Roseospira marina]KAA5604580.1 DUF3035 domain-containing protein [Roseospira marina]MBB4315330.1 hypothetical protein [Roseospira marina]MBB5088329.1 hypothetical protein [Roseospira marina]